MNILSHIFRIAYDELKNIIHDGGVMLFLFFMPLGYPILYALIYTNEVVREVPTVVLDECNSANSRDFLRRVDAAPEAKLMATAGNLDEAKERLKEDAFCIVRIPADFDRCIMRGEQTTVGIYCDMGSMMYYKSLLTAVSGVASQMNKEILVACHSSVTTDRQAELTAMPVVYDNVSLYNPQNGFAGFLVPPVLVLIIQQSMMLAIGMMAGGLRQKWYSNIPPPNTIFSHPMRIVAGRSLVYFGIYMLMAIYMGVFVTRWFELPQLAHYTTFVAFMVPYILSCVFFALVCSGFIYRREDCVLLFVFFSAPLLFLSGISWPGASMPVLWKVISCIFPSSFGINGYVRISGMGATLEDVSLEYSALWIQAGVYFLLACLLYRHQLSRLTMRKLDKQGCNLPS